MTNEVPSPKQPAAPTLMQRWQAFSVAFLRAFHRYASWLVSISWNRFVVLSVALLIGANVLQHLPPFTWKINDTVTVEDAPADNGDDNADSSPAEPPETPAQPQQPQKSEPPQKSEQHGIKVDKPIHYEISIDDKGLRIHPTQPAGAASAAGKDDPDLPSVDVRFPADAPAAKAAPSAAEGNEAAIDKQKAELAQLEQQKEELRKAAEQVRESIEASARQAERQARNAAHHMPRIHHSYERLGDGLVNLAMFWILASAVIKATYKGRLVAEKKAAQAAETAEAESLKRQVVEARMAAMQAQVEPHFLFNTLASIDHLIETDPARASQMQKNLIALLRASMPTMREANHGGVRELSRELAVVRPYLEILKVRMEERLQTEIDVPEGLHSAEFPPMMIQGLVENAIKHGLEPKAEGGKLSVKAEIVHGKLAVTVADTGLGFGRAATSGTGVGLANIRERLSLLYGNRAGVTISENQPSGTRVTITVPYVSRTTDEGVAA
ncbi:MAG: histidine kinase [Paucibacter sp.]|nr:histidine kinase [Roseateles sp.]